METTVDALVHEEEEHEREHEPALREFVLEHSSSSCVDKSEDAFHLSSMPSAECTRLICDFPSSLDEKMRRFIERPGFYATVLRPFYEKLPVPGIILREFAGGKKFFNRCARAGLITLIEAPRGGHGAFLLKPNPGYHDPVAAAVRAHRHKRGLPAETQAAVEAAMAAAAAAGPCAGLDFSRGFSYVAWWVHPSLLAPLRDMLRLLAGEAAAHAASGGSAATGAAAAASGAEAAAPDAAGTPPASPSASASASAAAASVSLGRQASEHTGVGDFTIDAETGVPRGPEYLHTMRDLQARRDAPLLQALLEQGAAFLVEKTGQPPAHMAFHYPYEPFYSTLHVHIQSADYPGKGSGSGRRHFHIHDILEAWREERGDAAGVSGGAGAVSSSGDGFCGAAGESASAGGAGATPAPPHRDAAASPAVDADLGVDLDLMERSAVNMWWPRGEPAMQFLMDLAGPGQRVMERPDGIVEFV